MSTIFLKLKDLIQHNGLEPSYSNYEAEKLIAFNWQVFICLFSSILFSVYSFLVDKTELGIFCLSYTFCYTICFYCLSIFRFNLARNIYLFVTNYSVFSISYYFGYESGFYFYFLTTPLTVYITYDNTKKYIIYIALVTYLLNAYLMNYLHHSGLLLNPERLDAENTNILFNMNLTLAFIMIFLLVRHLTKINALRTEETEKLHQKRIILEAEIHRKELNETRTQFQYQQLEAEYRQLDMFSHIISHNLRGPISRVIGIIELLRMQSDFSDDQEILLKHLQTSAFKIDEVIKDLNYILVQKKLGQESVVSVCFANVLSEVKVLLAEEIENSKAVIIEDIQIGRIPTIKEIMISICYNLISNGIKYAKRGQPPHIRISVLQYAESLELTFQDSGIGFDSSLYGEQVFRIYNRLHSHVNGKGIGLYLVKSHIDMLGGSIIVESQPGIGTKFVIRFPLDIQVQSSKLEDLLEVPVLN